MSSYDGTLRFNTKIDNKGFTDGVGKLKGLAQKSLGTVEKLFKGAGVAAVGFGASSIKAGASFEAGMKEVQAISGASANDLEKLTNKAKEMGAKTKFSATESAEALKYMAMAGWETEEMLDGIDGVMNLAAASGENLGAVSDILTDSLSAFGLEAKDAGEFADILAKTATSTNTNVGMMGETFKYVAPVAGALGYEVEDVALAIGIMANNGIKGSIAGNSLKNIMSNLANPTKEVASGLDMINLSAEDFIGISFHEQLAQLRVGFSNLTEEQKAQAAMSIAGRQGMSGLLAVMNATDEEFESIYESLLDANGAAEEMSKIMQDNLIGDFTIMRSVLEAVKISFFETFGQSLRESVQSATNVLQDLNFAIQGIDIQDLSNEISDLGINLENYGVSIYDVVNKMKEFSNEAEFVTFATEEWGMKTEDASSIWKEFKNNLDNSTDTIKLVSDVLGNALAGALISIAEAAPQVIELLENMVNSFLNSIKNNASNFGKAGADIVTSLIKGITNVLPNFIETAILLISEFIKGLSENTEQIVETGTNLIITLQEVLLENIPLLIEAGYLLISNLVISMIEALPEFISEFINNFSESFNIGLTEMIPDLANNLLTLFKENILENIVVFAEIGADLIRSLGEFISNNLEPIVQTALTIVTELALALIENVDVLIEAGIVIITALFDAVIEILPELITTVINSAITLAKTLITKGIPTVIDALVTIITKGIPQVVKAAKEIVKNACEALDEMIDGFKEAAKDSVDGLIKGIKDKISEAVEAVKELGKKILDGIKSFFGISSPSTVMATVGNEMVNGIIKGIRDKISEAVKAITKLAEDVKQKLQEKWKDAQKWGSDMINKVKTGIENKRNSIANAAKNVAVEVVNSIKNAFANAQEIGANFISGIKSGISSMASSLAQSAKEAASSAYNAVTGFFDIRSPSRKMRDDVGIQLMKGWGLGIEKGIPIVLDKFNEAMKNFDYNFGNQLQLANATAGYGSSTGTNIVNNETNIEVTPKDSTDITEARNYGRELGREYDRELRRRGIK